ncbi:MAG: hypothetical protein EBY54_04200 [Proteobacteria bacterium]|nr:hypothetical protein [Pseudomonadota bacterium]
MENNKLESTSVEFQYGNKLVKLETNKIARQATAAVVVTIDDLVVLTTVVAKKEADPGKDFFPLAVFYQEKFYATGIIPGGFFKREARPTERETLTSRLIDRPIRPLFPEEFKNEVQVFSTVMSSGKDQNPDIAAMIGASAALCVAGVPFDGPMGAARVGFIDGNYVLNPSFAELEESYLDMVVAGTEQAVLMVESEAKELSEDLMLGAVLFGHQEMQAVIKACNDLKEKAFGCFRHDNIEPSSPYLRGFSDDFIIPVSRWTELDQNEVDEIKDLKTLLASAEVGPCLIEDKKHNALYILNHFEYDSDTLKQEYDRDVEEGKKIILPQNYYPDDNPQNDPKNRWRSHAHLLYGNWINEIYQTTPYDLNKIGS